MPVFQEGNDENAQIKSYRARGVEHEEVECVLNSAVCACDVLHTCRSCFFKYHNCYLHYCVFVVYLCLLSFCTRISNNVKLSYLYYGAIYWWYKYTFDKVFMEWFWQTAPGEDVAFWTQLFVTDFLWGRNDWCALKVKTAQFMDSCLLWRQSMVQVLEFCALPRQFLMLCVHVSKGRLCQFCSSSVGFTVTSSSGSVVFNCCFEPKDKNHFTMKPRSAVVACPFLDLLFQDSKKVFVIITEKTNLFLCDD